MKTASLFFIALVPLTALRAQVTSESEKTPASHQDVQAVQRQITRAFERVEKKATERSTAEIKNQEFAISVAGQKVDMRLHELEVAAHDRQRALVQFQLAFAGAVALGVGLIIIVIAHYSPRLAKVTQSTVAEEPAQSNPVSVEPEVVEEPKPLELSTPTILSAVAEHVTHSDVVEPQPEILAKTLVNSRVSPTETLVAPVIPQERPAQLSLVRPRLELREDPRIPDLQAFSAQHGGLKKFPVVLNLRQEGRAVTVTAELRAGKLRPLVWIEGRRDPVEWDKRYQTVAKVSTQVA